MPKAAYSLAIALLLAGCYRTIPATVTVKGAPDAVAAFVAEAGATGDFQIETRKVGDQETATFTPKTGGADGAMALAKAAMGRPLSVEYKAASSSFSLVVPHT